MPSRTSRRINTSDIHAEEPGDKTEREEEHRDEGKDENGSAIIILQRLYELDILNREGLGSLLQVRADGLL